MINQILNLMIAGANQADAGEEKHAGLIDTNGLCVNAIVVKIDAAGTVIGYTPPDGLSIVVSDDAAIGRIWDGKAFKAA